MSANNRAESSWISDLSSALPTPSHDPTTASLGVLHHRLNLRLQSYRNCRHNTSYTAELCREIFRNPPPNRAEAESNKLTATTPSHHRDAVLADLALNGRKSADLERAYKEVAQHAEALVHLVNHIILRNEPWSEELILQTHRILCNQLSTGSRSAKENDEIGAGKYRTHEAAVKYDLKGGGKPKKTLCI